MTLDRIENNTFILQNTDFNHSPVMVFIYFFLFIFNFFKPSKVIRIGLTNPYYAPFYSRYYKMLYDSLNRTGRNFYDDGTTQMQLVNETLTYMHYYLWYLLPDAFSLELVRRNDAFSSTSDSSDLSDTSDSANSSDGTD